MGESRPLRRRGGLHRLSRGLIAYGIVGLFVSAIGFGSTATLIVPLGTSFRDCIAAVGGLTTDDPVLCLGGMMMGETTDELDRPVTKTTGGAIVLARAARDIAPLDVVHRQLRGLLEAG